jgi:hypothetical protein
LPGHVGCYPAPRESRDPPPRAPRQSWSCPSCTYVNAAVDPRCEMCDHWRPASASPAAVGLGRSASVGSGASASGPRAGAGVRASFRAPGRSAGVVPGTVMAAPCETAVPDKNEPARQAIGAVAEGPHAPKTPQEEGAACTQVPVLAAAPAPLPPPPPPCLPARIVLPKRGEWLHVDSPGVVVGAENL